MKVQEIKNTDEKELPICAYGCNKKAHYLIGTAKKPCCSSHFSKCPAVVKISVQHGKATKKERYGDENYNNSQQRGETNQLRYGNTCSLHGDEPAKKPNKHGQKNMDLKIVWILKLVRNRCNKECLTNMEFTTHFKYQQLLNEFNSKMHSIVKKQLLNL